MSAFFVAISINAEVVWFDGKSPITYSTPKNVEPVVKIALNKVYGRTELEWSGPRADKVTVVPDKKQDLLQIHFTHVANGLYKHPQGKERQMGSMLRWFEVAGSDGRYTVETALIPTQPNDNGDLRFSVAIDGGTPIIFTLKEPFRSEQWKQNVLRGQALREFKAHLSPAPHTITIQALDNHIVIDQLFII